MKKLDTTATKLTGLVAGIALALPLCALATTYLVTPGQKATASQVAESGVPLSELAPNAPDSYTIKSGDTLWAISGIFLKTPWRWPELWGMNMSDIRNPHLIYPGQVLVLDKSNGRARLRLKSAGEAPDALKTVKMSPHTRYGVVADMSIPTLKSNIIEPFLAEALIVDKDAFDQAPRIVSAQEGRVMLSRGDRAYAKSNYKGQDSTSKLVIVPGKSRALRVYRNATPLKDPGTGEILGYEAQYIGKAELVRSEGLQNIHKPDGTLVSEPLPATIDITASVEEMRTGDRLMPEPERSFQNYVPRAPQAKIDAQIVSVYGNAVKYVAQNQVVAINKGSKDGVENGHVLAILKNNTVITDKTDGARPDLTLPTERNGLLMVFRSFDRLSYALVIDTVDGVQVGDRLVNPR
jgi:LysM repeat protein